MPLLIRISPIVVVFVLVSLRWVSLHLKSSYEARIIHQLTLARHAGLSLLELETQTHLSPEVLNSLLKELEAEQKVVFRNRWYLSP
jgi:hypothetical protein